ncbi:hypothetical protein [Pseudomonas sp. CNPSo 3701]|uniref:hypothetical protein n=1 Tax=Pseudomonas sp. CNPSo 3701 TaxID=3027943 RepID=UPI0023631ED2|nr:hypothetical protein [Pseudomonas sp. CNPSo 3701]MDD1508789.1 hypothetical protein [Pseudomonas sp. CNPSo 3701]
MTSLIIKLWEHDLLPIKDGIYFSDGRAYSCTIRQHPRLSLENGPCFDLDAFHANNSDELTAIDGLKQIRLSNLGYCRVGEGSHGSEGFIAYLDSEQRLIWVIYAQQSNPFTQVGESPNGLITAISTADIRLEIDVDEPLGLRLSASSERR